MAPFVKESNLLTFIRGNKNLNWACVLWFWIKPITFLTFIEGSRVELILVWLEIWLFNILIFKIQLFLQFFLNPRNCFIFQILILNVLFLIIVLRINWLIIILFIKLLLKMLIQILLRYLLKLIHGNMILLNRMILINRLLIKLILIIIILVKITILQIFHVIHWIILLIFKIFNLRRTKIEEIIWLAIFKIIVFLFLIRWLIR